MSSEEVFEKVKKIIVNQLGVADTAVTLEASFIDDLGADCRINNVIRRRI